VKINSTAQKQAVELRFRGVELRRLEPLTPLLANPGRSSRRPR
jgi:hypothetical protein